MRPTKERKRPPTALLVPTYDPHLMTNEFGQSVGGTFPDFAAKCDRNTNLGKG